MAVFQKIQSFSEALAQKKIDLSADVLAIALCSAANAPDPDLDKVLADLTQIDYTFCSARALTITSAVETAGLLKLLIENLVLTASGGAVGPFRYVVLFSDSATNDDLVCFWDIGFEVTMADTDTFDVNFDQVNGVLQIQ